MAEPSENQKLAKAKSSPNTKASKAPKLDADLDAEAVHDANDLPSEAEDATDLLGVDGVDDSELGELQAVGLVADANAARHNPWQQWQDASQDLTEQVALQGDEPEFLNDQRFWTKGPTWCTVVSRAADANIEVAWNSASITAAAPLLRRRTSLLVSKVLEFKQNDGIIVDNSRRHDFMTVLKWEEITPRDREWMKTLSAEQQIVVLPARLPNEVAVEKGALVEVQAENWIPAVVTSDAFHDQVWVSVEGKQMEVDKSKIRARFDLVAIFGDREKRASAQLTIMSTKWKDQSGCDFGQHGAIALAEDGEWGTYRRYFPDEHFVNTVSTFVGKVLQPASGCAVRFVGQMAFCTGYLRQRSCAAALLKDLQKAYANYGEVPAKSGERRFSLRIKASQSLATISDMMRRELGKRLPERRSFRCLSCLAGLLRHRPRMFSAPRWRSWIPGDGAWHKWRKLQRRSKSFGMTKTKPPANMSLRMSEPCSGMWSSTAWTPGRGAAALCVS
ncbi:unnamed protein product [Effrenium voratum]|nr:unnamed protein product [Effrenium voratum]